MQNHGEMIGVQALFQTNFDNIRPIWLSLDKFYHLRLIWDNLRPIWEIHLRQSMQNHGEMIGVQAKQRHQRSHCSFPDFGAFGFVSPGDDFSQSHLLFSCNFKKNINKI